MNWGIRVLQTLALPLGYGTGETGAGDEARTRYLHLGKVALYQMSYTRITAKAGMWCLRSESNQRHGDFQSPALPTELSEHVVPHCGYEILVGHQGLEPRTCRL